jgi:hypothetical protein
MYGYITLKPYKNNNINTIYTGFGYGTYTSSYTVAHRRVGPGTYGIYISASRFKRNNAYLVVEINTLDSSDKFISGSFAHSILLCHPSYTNQLYNCTIPDRTWPGETCTINIVQPQNPSGVTCDVDILYNSSIGRQTIATKRTAGPFSFTVPQEATNSSITVRITTKNSRGTVLGVLPQSIKIQKPESYRIDSTTSTSTTLPEPIITAPALTLSEGAPIQFKGTSHNLNDYMVVYAKRPVNVAEAVKDYNGENGYYSASATELKNRLLSNATGDPSYYVLKPFDATSSFISQDNNQKNLFHIRTPNTNDYQDINNLYLLQWFQGVEPGDLVYVYIIERGIKYTTTVTTTTSYVPDINGKSYSQCKNWACRHCDLNNYSTWSISSNWSPYCTFDLAQTKLFLSMYEGVPMTATFTLSLNRTVTYPPTVFISTVGYDRMRDSRGCLAYLTPISGNNSDRFTYSIPISVLLNLSNQGYTKAYFNTHWGANTHIRNATFIDKYVEITAKQQGSSSSYESNRVTTTSTTYTDNRYTNINNIPLSSMTPVAVIPPAVRPVELALKNNNTKQITVNYTNPLYGMKTYAASRYISLGSAYFDVSEGDDKNNYSDLNAIIDEEGNIIQMDPSLDLNMNETRYETYEKAIKIPDGLLNKLKATVSNSVYVDITLTSSDEDMNYPINFKDITSNNSKIQFMLSRNGEGRTGAINLTSEIIDLKQKSYLINKLRFDRDLLVNGNYDTIHILYNTDRYDNGKIFETTNWVMNKSDGTISKEIGWEKAGNNYTSCHFNSNTKDIAIQALFYNQAKIRLTLENLKADKPLFAPPTIVVEHRPIVRNKETVTKTTLIPYTEGEVQPGEDIYYDIPQELYNANYEDILIFHMTPGLRFPINTPEISFSNAIIEVVEVNNMEDSINKYSNGFTAKLDFFEQKNDIASTSSFDPVQCIDVIMCCYDKNKQLINKTPSKRRDIYNGKELIYYTDRKWHNLVNDKYIYHPKYKKDYDMIFNVPDGTEYMYFIAFTYGDWFGNPSVYSMSNVLTLNSIKQDFSLEFISPTPIKDTVDPNILYANTELNNPVIEIKVNSQINSAISVTNNLSGSNMNLAKDPFDINKWKANPIIYSNNKTYGYELPVFNAVDAYSINTVVSSSVPLYNNIEHYKRWESMYGKTYILAPSHETNNSPITLNSNYTVYEDSADKFISNNAIPYVEIPAEIAKYDRSKITLFLDADFGKEIFNERWW